MALTEKPASGDNTNQTTFGSSRAGRGVVAVNAGSGLPSGLAVVDAAGVEWLIWVQSGTNKLTIGTRAQFVAQSGGTAVH